MSDKQPHGHAPETFDTEIDVRRISAFLVWLCVGVVATAALMYAMYRTLQSQEEARDLPASPLVDRSRVLLPPEPRLQVTPHPDLDRFLLEQRASVTTYGWVDPSQGVARIPVDRAIDVLAHRGLPWRASGGAPAVPVPQPAVPAPEGRGTTPDEHGVQGGAHR